jgi:hypothetical protein
MEAITIKRIKKRAAAIFIFCLVYGVGLSYGETLPKPAYDNTVYLSFYYDMVSQGRSEIDYLNSQFGGGLYARLHLSRFGGLDLNWNRALKDADAGIQGFKDIIDSLVIKAKRYKVGIHVGLTLGLSRNKYFYLAAKKEDTRNAQWFNDNNLAALNQLGGGAGVDDDSLNTYVFGTLSRYARKLRAHLEAKTRAGLDYLKKVQRENPDLVIIVSGPGEAELSFRRLNNRSPLQEFFCDYSPFAVLEFRDWIRHDGLYGSGGKYEGEGYINGGSRYRGANGLENFNDDFGVAFSAWKLKYYHWNLTDPVDANYKDNYNPDPNIIPIASHTYDGMTPASGPDFVAGGFDPPRVMLQKGENRFWDLWQTFRETMVYHYVKDIAKIVKQSGFPIDQFYSHQIPGDYLFGARPNDPDIPYLNPRFYSSASALWTAGNDYGAGLGITMYDINYQTWYASTSKYILPDVTALSDNWGIVEYNPEIVVTGNASDINTTEFIYEKMMNVYNHNVHLICFFKWLDSLTYKYKGNNRELAARRLFKAIKDKARQPIDTVFTPVSVTGFAGNYDSGGDSVLLTWPEKIWSDLDHKWKDWGDFKEFVIYRGYTAGFACNSSSRMARLTGNSYKDAGFFKSGKVYYKIAAENVNGEQGALSAIEVAVPNLGQGNLELSTYSLHFGATENSIVSPAQTLIVRNTTGGAMVWTVEAAGDASWLSFTPASGVNHGVVEVRADAAGKAPGTYSGALTVGAANATGSPRTVNVTLRVYESGKDAAPFGTWDSPVHGSTARGSTAVTGWVLDDIGVESVDVYYQKNSGLEHLGEATFIEGARPDVAVAYPAYPGNHKAGWGYMMLTNFLPGQGNGDFTIHVIARDGTGHEVTLGARTITCANASAVKPFGAIDTPGQGGTVSGPAYVNFGWVLTPRPNKIPTDGSTIRVYVDGVNIGHPVYNNYRKDIATLFPNYANSNGAVGYFYLDATAYENGLHTIQWVASDNAGNTDGIGSRYFNVQNSQARSAGTASVQAYRPDIDPGRLPVGKSRPVAIRKGYDEKINPRLVYPDESGIITVNIKQMERLEIHFPGFEGAVWAAGAFPTGSTLDSGKGIYYWQPSYGFYGEHRLLFITSEGDGELTRMALRVTINN